MIATAQRDGWVRTEAATIDGRDVTVAPVAAACGAVITGIQWGVPSEELLHTLTIALRRHLLLIFRGQPSPSFEQLSNFFRPFGRLLSETRDGKMHYDTFSNDEKVFVHRKDSFNFVVNTAEGAGELLWHNDQAHRPQLKILSVLEAIDVEDGAVPTMFRDMYTAYEMLSPEVKARLQYKMAVHFDPRQLATAPSQRSCDAMHPVFIHHPHSGRVTLYLGEWTYRIAGMPDEESKQTMDALQAHAQKNAPLYAHSWHNGDLCVWDNVGLQHRRDAMPVGQRRVLRVFDGVAE